MRCRFTYVRLVIICVKVNIIKGDGPGVPPLNIKVHWVQRRGVNPIFYLYARPDAHLKSFLLDKNRVKRERALYNHTALCNHAAAPRRLVLLLVRNRLVCVCPWK